MQTNIAALEYTFYETVPRVFSFHAFSAFDIRLISVTFTRHKLRLKRPFRHVRMLIIWFKAKQPSVRGLVS